MTETYLFAQVAHAIGSTPKSLRNWMQRAQITFDEMNVPGWRRFNLVDVARLTLIRHLVDAAVPVGEANAIVFGLPRTVLVDFARRDDLLVWWFETNLGSPHHRGVVVESGINKPFWDIVAQTHCPEYATTTFHMLHVGPVIRRAMARLDEPSEGAVDA